MYPHSGQTGHAEARLVSFGELAATAIANADSRAPWWPPARVSSPPPMRPGDGSNVTSPADGGSTLLIEIPV